MTSRSPTAARTPAIVATLAPARAPGGVRGASPGQFTPTEVALLFADRFLPSFPEPFAGAYRVPLSGRYLDVESLGRLLAETLLAALLDRGTVRLMARARAVAGERSPEGFVRLTEASGGDAPADSPEARVERWLERQSSHEGWLDDLFQQVVPRGRGVTPAREACDQALLRLEHAGIVVPLMRRVLQLNKMREYDVVDRHRVVLAGAHDAEVRALVQCRARLTREQLALVREGWRVAVLRRTDEG